VELDRAKTARLRADMEALLQHAQKAIALISGLEGKDGMDKDLAYAALEHTFHAQISLERRDDAQATSEHMAQFARAAQNPLKLATAHRCLAVAAREAGDLRQAVTHAQDMYQTLLRNKNRGLLAEACDLLGGLYHALGEHSKAVGYFSECLEIKRDFEDTYGMAMAMLRAGSVLNDQGRHQAAFDHLSAALLFFEKTGSQGRVADACLGLGDACAAKGIVKSALRYYSRAAAIARETKNEEARLCCLVRSGNLLARLGKPAEALSRFRDAAKTAAALGFKERVAECHFKAGHAFALAGRPGEALKEFARAKELCRDLGSKGPGEGAGDSLLMDIEESAASIHSAREDHAAAMEALNAAYALAVHGNNKRKTAYFAWLGSIVLRAKGEPDTAAEYQLKAYEVLSQVKSHSELASHLVALANAFLGKKDPDSAMALAKRAVKLLAGNPNKGSLAAGYVCLAAAHAGKKNTEQAVQLYRKAVSLAGESGDQSLTVSASLALAKLLQKSGNYKESMALYEKALGHGVQIEDLGQAAQSYWNLGMLRMYFGEREKSVKAINQAEGLWKRTGEVPEKAKKWLAERAGVTPGKWSRR
jgi:tetratricopeptide (TPR) repeat protein